MFQYSAILAVVFWFLCVCFLPVLLSRLFLDFSCGCVVTSATTSAHDHATPTSMTHHTTQRRGQSRTTWSYMSLCTCLCTGLHACLYACLCKCPYSSLYPCLYRCLYACLCSCLYACVCICLHMCMHMSTHVCMYKCLDTCLHMSACIHV